MRDTASEAVKAAISNIMEVDPAGLIPGLQLADLGMNSITRMLVINRIADAYDAQPGPEQMEELFGATTLEDFIYALRRMAPEVS